MPDGASDLIITDLSQRLGSRWVLKKLNIIIPPRTCTVLMGPNGSGKTTLLKNLATLHEYSRGTITNHQWDWKKDREDVRSQINYLGHQLPLYPTMTVEEHLEWFQSLLPRAIETLNSLLALYSLETFRKHPIRELSKGTQKRVALALLHLKDSQYYFLDEPFSNLDQENRKILSAMLMRLKEKGKTIVFSAHELDESLALASHLLILKQGKVNYWGDVLSIPEITSRLEGETKL